MPDPPPEGCPDRYVAEYLEGLKLAKEKMGFDIEAEKMMKAALEKGDPPKFVVPTPKAAPKPASNASTSVMAGDDADAARLRSYIAKVTANAGTSCDTFGIGMMPPSRSYRGLLTFAEFQSIPTEIKRCMSKPELASVSQRWKQNKTALTELQSMVRAAEARVATTLQQARQKVAGGGDAGVNPIANSLNGPDGDDGGRGWRVGGGGMGEGPTTRPPISPTPPPTAPPPPLRGVQ